MVGKMDYSEFAVVRLPSSLGCQANEPICRHRGFIEESGDGCYSHPVVCLSPKPGLNGNPLILPVSKGSQFMYKAKVMLKCALGSMMLLMVAALPALAAEEKAAGGTPQAHVVLVGISDYADKQIKPRKF